VKRFATIFNRSEDARVRIQIPPLLTFDELESGAGSGGKDREVTCVCDDVHRNIFETNSKFF